MRTHVASITVRAASMGLLGLTVLACANPRTASPADAAWAPGNSTHELTVDSGTRTFQLHVPSRRPRGRFGLEQPFPLILVLHGSGADGQDAQQQSGMDSVADANGWLVAYPDAVSGLLGFRSDWNAGTCCGIAARDSVNDVRFLLAVIDDVHARLPVNPRRVYVAGFSAGARMAYHLACRAAPRIAAIAIVAGSVRDSACAPTMPVPLIAFHGTDDDEVPYAEPSDTPLRGIPPDAGSLPPAVQLWSALDGCQSLTAFRQAAAVTMYAFRRCRAEVVFYSVSGGKHGWPGERDGAGSAPPMSEIQATPIIARFFARHIR